MRVQSAAPRLALAAVFSAVALLSPVPAQTPSPERSSLKPGRKYTTVERMSLERLEAVHQARLQFARERKDQPAVDIYRDIRAVMHIHAEDAPHTQGTRAQVLEGAKAAQVQAVLWSEHKGPKPDTWTGMHDGVLFLAGAEEDHRLRFPGPDTLLFLSHLEERPDASAEGFVGMEIYNRHTDQTDEKEFEAWFGKAMKDPAQWAKIVEAQKRYPDEVFAAAGDFWPELIARWDKETASHTFTGIAANDAHRNQVYNGVVFDPYEVAFRNVATHILARELSDAEVRKSLREGRAYVSHDWLCDATTFTFGAVNNLGVFSMGDRVPMLRNTRLAIRTPLAAHLKVFAGGQLVKEASGVSTLDFTPDKTGAYRVEAWLTVDGEERPWIYSNPIFMVAATPAVTALPPVPNYESVEVVRNIDYVTGGEAQQANKHRLDLYLPKGKKNVPVLFFVHGGAWRSGDRSLYGIIGQHFANLGYVVAIPSYRLAPANQHPAQIEDVAAAFAWVKKNIAERGGDPGKITIAGHSAGGHLVALLALDPSFLAAQGLKPSDIRSVVASSGVYDVANVENVFGQKGREASPMTHVLSGAKSAPPITITYCQWDYALLPRQAILFDAALRQAGARSKLLYVPGESHISEIISAGTKAGDPTERAILERLEER